MKYRILGIGEVLWDLLPTGRKMGGAPANFAYHAHALGADAKVISRVGDDSLGHEIVERLTERGLSTHCISFDPMRPTGTVSVQLSEDGQPCYIIHEGVAWDYLDPVPALLVTLGGADAVCFGSLGQRCESSRQAIKTLVGHAPRRALRIFDVNLRQNFYSAELVADSLRLANVLKLNDQELPILAKLLDLPGSSKEQLSGLLHRYDLNLVACTCGADGSVLYDGSVWSEHPGFAAEVKDTVGAGDSFTAAITLGMLSGWPLDKISQLANEVAAYVCSCDGAMPDMPPELAAHFGSYIQSRSYA